METFLYGVLTFLLVLGPLVILHEFGHFFVAKMFGVKVLEYGFGFPPMAAGWWTGNTTIYLTGETWFAPELADNVDAPVTESADGSFESMQPQEYNRPKAGDIVTVRAVEMEPHNVRYRQAYEAVR